MPSGDPIKGPAGLHWAKGARQNPSIKPPLPIPTSPRPLGRVLPAAKAPRIVTNGEGGQDIHPAPSSMGTASLLLLLLLLGLPRKFRRHETGTTQARPAASLVLAGVVLKGKHVIWGGSMGRRDELLMRLGREHWGVERSAVLLPSWPWLIPVVADDNAPSHSNSTSHPAARRPFDQRCLWACRSIDRSIASSWARARARDGLCTATASDPSRTRPGSRLGGPVAFSLSAAAGRGRPRLGLEAREWHGPSSKKKVHENEK